MSGLMRKRYVVAGMWLLILSLSFIAFSPMMNLGLIADDAALFIGVSSRMQTQGILAESLNLLSMSSTGNHLLPIGAAVTAGYVIVANFLTFAGISGGTAWEVLRILLLVLVCLSIALCLSLLPTARLLGPSRSFRLLVNFSLVTGLFVLLTQIHAVWSNDPIVSYPLAGLVSVILGFAYWASLFRISRSTGRFTWWVAFIAVLVGVFGILNYELMICAVAAAALSMIAYFAMNRARSLTGNNVLALICAVVLPTVAFAVQQLVRVSMPSDYAGTSGGEALLILPTLRNGLLSGIPLANREISSAFLGSSEFSFDVLVPVAAGGLLLSLAIAAYIRSRMVNPHEPALVRGSTFSLNAFAVLFALFAVMLFSLTGKYQTEIAFEVGRTYLFYVCELACIVVLCATALVASTGFRNQTFTFGLIGLLVLVSLIQWTINLQSINFLRANNSWTLELTESLREELPESARCAFARQIESMPLPSEYRENMYVDLERLHASKYGINFCASNQLADPE